MKILRLALRNLLRNRRRSLSTLLAVAIGSVSVLLFGGYTSNIKYNLQTGYVAGGGHLQIQHRSFYLYGSGDPTAYGISAYRRILDAIAKDPVLQPMVRVAVPTLQFGGLAGNYPAGVSRTVIATGHVAGDYERMRQWNEFNVPPPFGPFALVGTPSDAALVGVGLARVLQLCEALQIQECPAPDKAARKGGAALPDDIAQLGLLDAPPDASAARANPRRIELLASHANGTPNVASLSVVRAERQGFKELDDIQVQMHLDQAQRLIYGKTPPKVTAIMVQLHSSGQLVAAHARLDELLRETVPEEPLAVLDFKMLNPFFVQSMRLFDTIFGFMFALIGGIVLFTVGNTMNTAVMERTVEIGTLRAIGLRRSGIRTLFVLEGVLLGVWGALLGLGCALTLAFAINHMGLTWLPPAAAAEVPLQLRVWGEVPMMLFTSVGLVGIATVSAWWPAYRAARMHVVDALRHV